MDDYIIEGNPIPTSVVADIDKSLSQYLVSIARTNWNRVFIVSIRF